MSANPDRVDAATSPDRPDVSKDSKDTDKPQPTERERELERQLEHERNMRKSAETDREVWYQRAVTGQPAQTSAQPKQEDDFDLLSVNLVDLVAENNVGGIQKVIQAEARKLVREELKSGGYVSKEETERLVTAKASEIQQANQLMIDNPELADRTSPLRLEVARQLDIIGQDPEYRNLSEMAQVKIATAQARLKLGTTAKPESRQPSREDAIAAQQGQYGRRPTESGGGELTDSQKAAAAKYGVSEEAYKKNLGLTRMFGK